MSLKTLRGRYRYLAPIERLGLTLESLGRNDDEEIEALIRSCPISTYQLQDQAFWELHDQSKMVAYLFAIYWYRKRHEVDRAQSSLSSFFLIISLLEKSIKLGLKPYSLVAQAIHPVWAQLADQITSYEEELEHVKQEDRRCSAQLKGIHTGFLRFCEMAKLEPHQLLVWVPGLQEEVKRFLATLDPGIEADQEMAKVIFEGFLATWPRFQKEKF